MEKNSKSSSDLSSEEKCDENSNKNSNQEKKDDESNRDNQVERKKVMKVKVSNQMKKKTKLDKDVTIQFPMKLVHDLCLRRIFSKKKKEIWMDYNDLPICFSINEFAIMTELRCHSLPPPSQQLAKIEKEGEILIDKVDKKIEIHCLKIASEKSVFDSYSWGRVSFNLTISYILKELDSTKSKYNFHGFPWALAINWAFEAIPTIQ
ncbi:hypothetical protein H5410_015553 [Solanum commersonii]|uniref:DUF1985 domain-containing protein n=1 Tax=Solanum commersonii TaxID=4109 RepID=A0A9J5ZU35_SOLCO|nr:hypothetical protein H5410_015553 [Solanum commersonii]